MASSSSLSSTLSLLPLCNSTISRNHKPSLLSFSLPNPSPLPSLKSRSPPSRTFATPETLDGPVEEASSVAVESGATGTSLSVGADSDKLVFVGSPYVSLKKSGKQFSSATSVCNITQQHIIIVNKYGENLVGILRDTGSSNLVILCHGFRSSKESKTIMSIADAITKERISVFCFDFSGNGDSEGSFQYGNYWKEVDDLHTIIHYFSGQKRKVNAIAGHSKGGDVVLLYASVYHDIHTVVNISGRFNLKRGIESRLGKDYMQRIEKDGYIDVMDKKGRFMYRVTKESLMDRLSTDMHAACLSIDKSCRVLTIHGSEDDVVPPEDALEFAKFITNHKLHIIEGADHRYLSHQFELASTLLEFIGPDLLEDTIMK
ncbi:uncharacterized protein M6B38_138220 [Iris pallida]|uniref:Serine aminopeptidase S33 domain-containing protein n=1 Tax=Iris pallida TaxID=29817 RepID=A0AAX6FE86_IRIPA|nr:uncharacterized protein M6B38_138220 [Iris pallida]